MPSKVHILLGDIIELISPTNDAFHNQTFLVHYIDENEIHLKSPSSSHVLNLENNTLRDKSIKEIHILQRHEHIGFAKQNKLIPRQWININFNGDVPVSLTGEIISLDEDMIEIKLYPSGKVIYIDFEYKGLIPKLSIGKIELREPPKEVQENDVKVLNNNAPAQQALQSENDMHRVNNNDPQNENDNHNGNHNSSDNGNNNNNNENDSNMNVSYVSDMSPYVQAEIFVNTDMNEPDNIIQDDLNDTGLGRHLGTISQVVQVEESELRYGINMQMNDLLNDLISKLKVKQRNAKYYKFYENMIQRFALLRNEFSVFDAFHTPTSIKNDAVMEHVYNDVIVNKQNIPLWFYFTSPLEKKVLVSESSALNDETILLKDELDAYNNVYSLYLKTHDDQNKREMNDILSTYLQSTLFNNEELNHLTVHDNVHNHRIHVLSNKDNKLVNTIETIIPEETIPYDDFVLLNKHVILYELLRHSNQPILLHSKLAPMLKYINNEFNNVIPSTSSLHKVKKSFDNTRHCKRVSMFETTEQLFEKFLPSKMEALQFLLKFKEIQSQQFKHSMYDHIQSLRALSIHENHVDFSMYKEMKDDVYNTRRLIFNTKKQRKHNERMYIQYLTRNYRERDDFSLFSLMMKNINGEERKVLLNLLIELYFQTTFEKESIERNLKYFSPSEMLYRTMKDDNSEFLVNLLSYGNISLANDSIESMFVSFKKYMGEKETGSGSERKPISNGENSSNKCKLDILIAKKYSSHDELQDDNEKEIFFDKNYDNTYYPILDIYQDEKRKMTPSQFKIFLASKLVEVNNISEDESEYMVTTLLEGKKRVLDGQYCLLETLDEDKDFVQLTLYKRVNNKWVYDESATQQHQNNFALALNDSLCPQDVHCDVTLDIDNIKTDCMTKDERKKKIQNIVINNMMEEFKHIYAKNENELKEILSVLDKNLQRKRFNRQRETYKYSSKHDSIASFYDKDPLEDNIISPHLTLMNTILSNRDMREKFNQIVQFCQKHTRTPYTADGEDEHMLYCKDTNTPLMPTVFSELALAFKTNFETYQQTLRHIKNHKCHIGDNGENLVDKHSGYEIIMRDFDTDEGYDERGSKISTKTAIDDDDNEEMAQESMPNNLDDALTSILPDNGNTSIEPFHTGNSDDGNDDNNGDSEANDITDSVGALLDSLFDDGTEEEALYRSQYGNLAHHIIVMFENTLQVTFANKKKIMVHIIRHFEENKTSGEQTLALATITLCFIVIELQMQYHNLRTSQSYLSCKPFLKGYPLFHDSDTKTIQFVVCLAKTLNVHPDLQSINNDTIVTAIVQEIQHIMTTSMRVETNTFLNNYAREQNQNTATNDKRKTMQFLPYLSDVHLMKLKKYAPLSKPIDRTIKILSPSDVIVYASKGIELGAYIQHNIQHMVYDEEPHLRGRVIYHENFCCYGDNVAKKPLTYFENKSKAKTVSNGFMQYITHANEINTYLQQHQRSIRGQLSYDNRNTRQSIVQLNTRFSDDTVTEMMKKLSSLNDSHMSSETALKNLAPKQRIQTIHNQNLINNDVSDDSVSPKLQKFSKFTAILNDQFDKNQHRDNEERQNMKYISSDGAEVNVSVKMYENVDKLLGRIHKFTLNNESQVVKPTTYIEPTLHNANTSNHRDTSDTNTYQKEVVLLKNYIREQVFHMRNELDKYTHTSRLTGNRRNQTSQHVNMHNNSVSIDKLNAFMDDIILNKGQHIPMSYHKLLNIGRSFETLNKSFRSFFSSIQNGESNTLHRQYDYENRKHWKFHKDHNDDLHVLHEKNMKYIKNIYNRTSVHLHLKSLNDAMSNIDWFRNHVYLYIQEQSKLSNELGKEGSIQNTHHTLSMNILIHIYLFYYTLTTFMTTIEETQDIQMKQDGNIVLTNILEYACAKLIHSGFDKSYIQKKVIQSKESEKNRITNELFNMNDEERETYMMMKKHKLGRSGKGLSKSIFAYVANEYTENRNLFVEQEEHENNDISNMDEDYNIVD